MSPAHAAAAVLSNQELLRMVCEDVYKDSGTGFVELRSLALVCRTISDMALDSLWNSSRLNNLYCVFPENIITTVTIYGRGIKSFTRAPVTLKQWSRFSVHARRIRELSVSTGRSDISLSAALAHYPWLHHPFPRLTCLNLTTTPKLVTYAKVVTETCSFLRRFRYEHNVTYHHRRNSLDDALTSLIHHSVHLQSADVPGSRNVLDALSCLPSLSRLHLSCDNQQLLRSGSRQEQGPLDQERFRALECLQLECPDPLEILVECLRGMGCFPRKELKLYLMSPAPWSTLDVEQLVHAVLHPDRSVELWDFEIITAGGDIGTVPWQPFWKLLSTTHLQKLAFEDLDVDIDDSDLKAISSTLRELTFLAISPSGSSTSRITFQGVAHLASLPNLNHVSLRVRDDATISQSMLPTEIISTSPLTSISINGTLTGVTAFQVTSFLVKYFPKLTEVSPPSLQSIELWSEVQKDLEFARQLLHPLPKS